jgi:multidrug transporter EmrE-like cation transporter
MKPLGILLISVALTSIGQLVLKKGLLRVGQIEKLGLRFFQMLLNPLVIIGVIFAILGWAAYVIALSKAELSYAYPIWGLTYVIVPIFSLLIYQETIPLIKTAGLGFIFAGIFLVALSIK